MYYVYVCVYIYMYIYIYVRARTRSLYLRLSAPRNYQGRPSPRQFVKAVIIPADLWHCIHIGRCLPPDQITSPSALGRPGARSLLDGTDRRAPWKPSISSPRYYHRLGFWRPFQIKANQHADVSSLCDIPRRIYKYCLSFAPSRSFFSRQKYAHEGGRDGGSVPTCVTAVLRNTREISSDCNLYDWPSLHRDPSFAIMRKRCSRTLRFGGEEEGKEGTGYLLCIARLDSGEKGEVPRKCGNISR